MEGWSIPPVPPPAPEPEPEPEPVLLAPDDTPLPQPQAGEPPGTRPTVADVANLERARAVATSTGEQLDDFTTDTRPTAAQVDALIDSAVAEVLGRIPLPVAAGQEPHCAHCAALYAAMLIELSYYPEQTTDGQGSSFTALQGLFDDCIASLGGTTATGGGEGTPASRRGVYSIPMVSPAVEGSLAGEGEDLIP